LDGITELDVGDLPIGADSIQKCSLDLHCLAPNRLS
jgi:hypothetical protein